MKKSVFIAGWDVRLNGDKECNNYIKTQITTEEVVQKLDCGLELIFEEEKLVEAFDYDEGEKYMRLLLADEKGLAYMDYVPNKFFTIVEKIHGIHQLGGEVPNNFIFPDNNCFIPFQYLGFINNRDSIFDWLPFNIHLVSPIFLNIDRVFLDYSNPYHPIIINRIEVESSDTTYDDLDENSEIIFEEKKIEFIENAEIIKVGNAGIPIWTQYPQIPFCPKTGNLMKFLCQLNSGSLKAKRTTVIPKNENYRHYYEEFNFDGSLYVFVEPIAKTVCYFIQNT